jgi:hypothetical protein
MVGVPNDGKCADVTNTIFVTTQPKYIKRSPSQIPIWEGMFQKSFTLHYKNHIFSKLY